MTLAAAHQGMRLFVARDQSFLKNAITRSMVDQRVSLLEVDDHQTKLTVKGNHASSERVCSSDDCISHETLRNKQPYGVSFACANETELMVCYNFDTDHAIHSINDLIRIEILGVFDRQVRLRCTERERTKINTN